MVLVCVAGIDHRLPDLGVGRQAGELDHQFGGEVVRESDVFELAGAAAARGEVAAEHPLAVEFEDFRIGKAPAKGAADGGRIDPGGLGEVERLGDGGDSLRDDDLIGEFGDLAATWATAVGDFVSEAFEDGEGAGEVLGRATGHDRECGVTGALLAPRDGGIEASGGAGICGAV